MVYMATDPVSAAMTIRVPILVWSVYRDSGCPGPGGKSGLSGRDDAVYPVHECICSDHQIEYIINKNIKRRLIRNVG